MCHDQLITGSDVAILDPGVDEFHLVFLADDLRGGYLPPDPDIDVGFHVYLGPRVVICPEQSGSIRLKKSGCFIAWAEKQFYQERHLDPEAFNQDVVPLDVFADVIIWFPEACLVSFLKVKKNLAISNAHHDMLVIFEDCPFYANHLSEQTGAIPRDRAIGRSAG